MEPSNTRKKRSLVLRRWLFDHRYNAYPSDVKKLALAKEAGLTVSQLCSWLTNARQRILPTLIQRDGDNNPQRFFVCRSCSRLKFCQNWKLKYCQGRGHAKLRKARTDHMYVESVTKHKGEDSSSNEKMDFEEAEQKLLQNKQRYDNGELGIYSDSSTYRDMSKTSPHQVNNNNTNLSKPLSPTSPNNVNFAICRLTASNSNSSKLPLVTSFITNSTTTFSPQSAQDSFNNHDPNEPLDLSPNSTSLSLSLNPPNSTLRSPMQPPTHQEQFQSSFAGTLGQRFQGDSSQTMIVLPVVAPMYFSSSNGRSSGSVNCSLNGRSDEDKSILLGPPSKSSIARKERKNESRVFDREAKRVLRRWLFDHRYNAYPNNAEKLSLAKGAGLSMVQLRNWFINARRRILPTMIEKEGKKPHHYIVRRRGSNLPQLVTNCFEISPDSSTGTHQENPNIATQKLPTKNSAAPNCCILGKTAAIGNPSKLPLVFSSTTSPTQSPSHNQYSNPSPNQPSI